MKKVLILVLVLIFAGAVLSRNAYAEEFVEIKTVDYALTYPGLLPDSPFYILKNVRDQLVGLLVMGPVNKAFYMLMLSDKRLWAGQILVESGKKSLGATTFVKGEEYFSLAVDQAVVAKKQGKNVSELSAKLLVASSKHDELLNNAALKVSGADLQLVASAMALNEKSRSRILEL